MRVAGILAAILLLAVAASGCSQSSRADDVESKTLSSASAVQQPATLLRVLVVTDEFLPVSDAKVRVVGVGLTTDTDLVGNAYFQIAKPGRYSVHVNHRQFYPNVTKVEVGPTVAQVLRVTLRDAPRDGYYSDFYYFPGICQPVVWIQAVTPSADCPSTAYLPKPEPKWILSRGLTHAYLQLDWPNTPTAAKTMRIGASLPDAGRFADGAEEQFAQGPSPVRLEIPPQVLSEEMTAGPQPISIHIGLGQAEPVNENAYASFELTGQFDYHVAAPPVDGDG